MSTRPIQLPPAELLADRPIRQAIDTYKLRSEEYTQARGQHYDLVKSRSQAVDRDRLAYTEAIEEGKSDPGQEQTRAHDALVAEAARREEALELALERAYTKLLDAIERRKHHVVTCAHERAEKARQALAGAIEQVAEHRRSLAEAYALEIWVEKVASQGSAHWNPLSYLVSLRSLQGRGGDPVTVDQTLDALRALATPPDDHVTADQRSWTAEQKAAA